MYLNCYSWTYFADVLITKGRREIKRDGRLVIYGVYESDQGIYRCEANSSIGNYSTTVEVKVQGEFTLDCITLYYEATLLSCIRLY